MEELSKRKQKILRALVDEFVSTAEPVSSGDIKAKYMPEVSSATIRNDLAALEKMGYLEQPHTSSGRVPLPQAYKLYVENIIPDCVLTPAEIKYIRSSFDKKVDKVEDIIKQTAKVLADVTNYTSVIVVKNFKFWLRKSSSCLSATTPRWLSSSPTTECLKTKPSTFRKTFART